MASISRPITLWTANAMLIKKVPEKEIDCGHQMHAHKTMPPPVDARHLKSL